METKKFTQIGTFSIILLLPLLVLFIYMTYNAGVNELPAFIIFSSLSIAMLISLITFFKLVIEVDRVHVSFKLGIGLFSRQYKISNLKNCKPVKYSFFNGIGIRMFSNGWLYNVTGTKAIELSFKDSDKIIRIGTNNPDEIAEIIADFIEKTNEPIDYTARTNFKPRKNLNFIIIGSVLLIIVLFTIYGNADTKIILNNDNVEIGGMYGGQIKYTDIEKVDTLTWIPTIKFKTNGYAFSSVCKGHFRIKGIGDALVFADCSATPIIQLKLKSKEVYFLNFKERKSTIDLFKDLKLKVTK